MYKSSERYIRLLFYFLWLCINLLQAKLSFLNNDEAYYWLYAQHLSWGYYDHPPMVALLIKLGSSLIDNELGVRLLFVVCGTLLIYCIEKLVRPTNLVLFYMVISSIVIFHFGGFIACPDTALIFFTAASLLLYRKYLEKDDLKTSFLLGVGVALMIYSKYHAALVIVFILASNFSLLLKRSFWIVVFTSALLVAPHAWWEYTHHWPSFQYHFVERSKSEVRWDNFSEFVIGQVMVYGPIISLIFFWFVFRPAWKNIFERGLYFLMAGTFIFFMSTLLKGRVEPHWTSVAIIPFVYFGYKKAETLPKVEKLIRWSFPVSILLIFAFRIYIIVDYLPLKRDYMGEFHYCRENAEAIHKVAGNRPVVFFTCYQAASKYWYYTRQVAYSLNNVGSRKSQFDLWNIEDSLRGKNVLLFPSWRDKNWDSVKLVNETRSCVSVTNFQSFSRIHIAPTVKQYKINSGDSILIHYTIENQSTTPVDFSSNQDYPSVLTCVVYKGQDILSETICSAPLTNEWLNVKEHSLTVKTPVGCGGYYLMIGIKTGWFPVTMNSDLMKFQVCAE